LTDSRGQNLRNRVAHGLMAAEQFGHPIASRLVHVLLIISAVRADPVVAAGTSEDVGLTQVDGCNAEQVQLRASVEGRIPQDVAAADVASLIDGGLDETHLRIAKHFIEGLESLPERLRKIETVAQLPDSAPDDNDGEPIPPVVCNPREDEEGRLARPYAMLLDVSALFLEQVLDAFFTKYELRADNFVDRLGRSPLFAEDRRQLLCEGLFAYRSGDHAAAIHLLVPQVEQALRMQLDRLGGQTSVRKARKGDVYDEKDLNSLLGDPVMVAGIPQHILFYLNALLADSRGWNVRNVVWHGERPAAWFDRRVSDRLVHVLLLLSCADLLEGGNRSA
jgi:hypothetical protein